MKQLKRLTRSGMKNQESNSEESNSSINYIGQEIIPSSGNKKISLDDEEFSDEDLSLISDEGNNTIKPRISSTKKEEEIKDSQGTNFKRPIYFKQEEEEVDDSC